MKEWTRLSTQVIKFNGELQLEKERKQIKKISKQNGRLNKYMTAELDNIEEYRHFLKQCPALLPDGIGLAESVLKFRTVHFAQ